MSLWNYGYRFEPVACTYVNNVVGEAAMTTCYFIYKFSDGMGKKAGSLR